jgi:hypothetical protein
MPNKGDRKFEIFKLANYESIEIRFNSNSSTFYADFLGKRFANKDINELKSELGAEAKSRESTTWKPVILIKTGSWQWDKRTSGIEIEKRFLGTALLPTGEKEQFLTHVIPEMFKDELDPQNWKPDISYTIWKGDTREESLIDYTKERYEALIFIEQRMEEFKLRIIEIIRSARGAEFLYCLNENCSLFLPDRATYLKFLPEPEDK